jgi:hypothetical protein
VPTKRSRVLRGAVVELDEGQVAFLRGLSDTPPDVPVMAFNRWCWLSPPWVYADGDPEKRCRDGSPSPAALWRKHGREFVAEWDLQHPGQPHPLIEWLGEP